MICFIKKAGKSQTEIAEEIGFTQPTIYKQAQRLTSHRQEQKRKRSRVITPELAVEIEQRLRKKHSPEQISLYLTTVSYESIYRYIIEDRVKGGTLYQELRINSKRRYRRRVGTRRSKIPNRTGIEERAKVKHFANGKLGDPYASARSSGSIGSRLAMPRRR